MTLTRPLAIFLLYRNTPLSVVVTDQPTRALATTAANFANYSNTPMTSAAANAAESELFEMTDNRSSIFNSCADDEGAYEEPDKLDKRKLCKRNYYISYLNKSTYQALYLSPILCVVYSLAAGLICKLSILSSLLHH